MKKLSRAWLVAAAGVAAIAVGVAGGATTGTLKPIKYAKAAPSALLGRWAAKHPESAREVMAATASRIMRSGSLDADVVSARLAAFRQAAAIGTASGTYGHAWKELGPVNYDASQLGDGMTTNSGRVSAISVDPTNPNKLWIGTASGGVWYSSDAGAHWTPKFDVQPSLIIGALAVDPKDPKTVYVGTGDNATGGFYVFPGAGVFVTHDNGATWTHPVRNIEDASTVYHIEVTGSRVFVASNQGLFSSTDSGHSFSNVKLPTNASHSAPSASRLGSVVTDVRVKPGSPNDVIAVVGWRAGKYGNPHSDGNGLYQSTSGGAPGSWSFLDSNLGYASTSGDKVGRTALAFDPQKPDVLWALVEDPGKFTGDVLDVIDEPTLGAVFNPLNGVYRSGDGGKTWTLKAAQEQLARAPGSGFTAPGAGLPLYEAGVQSWYNEWIEVDPSNSGNVLVGLEEIYQTVANADSDQGVAAWKTVGRYWNQCLGGVSGVDCTGIAPLYPGQTTTHPDQHSVQIVKTPGGVRIYAGNDGGIYRQDAASGAGFTNDAWKHLNAGLGTLQPYYAVMAKDGTVYAGLQDNGNAKIAPNSTSGSEVFGGDGGDVAVEPNNSDRAWEEYVYADISVTSDGGRSWTDIAPTLDGAQFTNPFEMDPLDGNHVVVPAQEVVETTKGVDTRCGENTCDWMTSIDLATLDEHATASSGLDVRGAHIYVAYCGVCDVLTVGGGDPTQFHNGIATNVKDGCVATIGTDANSCWHAAKAAGLPKRYISDVAMDPSDLKTIYVTLSGWSRKWYVPRSTDPGVGRGQVFVSHDAGEHFTDITGNLPDLPANAALVRGDHVFVANDMGVYTAAKGSKAWARLGSGLPNAPASDLELNPQGTKLVVATFGRGVWTYDFGSAPAVSKGSTVLGTHKSRTNLPATGSDSTVAVGLALIASAALLRRRQNRA